jgi:hypothetical protein
MIEQNFKKNHKHYKKNQENKKSYFQKTKEIVRETTKSDHSGLTGKPKP